MNAADHICGNEEVWYAPLSKTDHAMPAYALENTYTGDGLGETWHNRLKRSASSARSRFRPSKVRW